MDEMEELRRLIIKLFLLISLFTGGVFAISGYIMNYLKAILPENVKVIIVNPYDMMLGRIKLSFVVSLLFLFPFVLFLCYRYSAPAMRKKEKAFFKKIFIPSMIFSYSGVIFAYVIVIPLSLKTLYSMYTFSFLEDTVSFVALIDYVILISVGLLVLFNLPVLLWNAVSVGFLSIEEISQARKYIILLLLIVSAFITPPDAISMFLVFIPLYLLFELTVTFLKLKNRV